LNIADFDKELIGDVERERLDMLISFCRWWDIQALYDLARLKESIDVGRGGGRGRGQGGGS
jgi:hypothetical protein